MIFYRQKIVTWVADFFQYSFSLIESETQELLPPGSERMDVCYLVVTFVGGSSPKALKYY